MKKKLKHQNHLKDLKQQQFIKYKKQIEYQLKNDQMPLLAKLGYQPYMVAKTLNQNYDRLIAPRIKVLSDPQWTKQNLEEDNKDNRTILANLNYAKIVQKDNDLNLYGGIVTGYRIVNSKLYFLISSVHALVQTPTHIRNKQFEQSFHFATDHLWIGIHKVSFSKTHLSEITISLGDSITFLGKVNAYRGKKENIKQTKFGVYDTVILDSGYPSFILNHPHAPTPNDYNWNIFNPIHYQHQSFLIKFNQDKPTNEYGDQFNLEKMS